MLKIVCDDKIPFLRGAFEPWAEVKYLPGSSITRDDVLDADAIVTRTRTRCDRSLLEGTAVRVIASATIGYDHIDTEWCAGHGIRWFNAPGCNALSVVQYVCSALCVLAERYGLELDRLTLGVVGAGNVGSRVAAVARSMGMEVLLCDPPRRRAEGTESYVDIDRIVTSCDIISLHVPLVREGEDRTEHLFDSARLASLRPDQILINTSRGQVVDCVALGRCLAGHRLRAAVLDVWEGEPCVDRDLLSMVDIGTPHIAGYSADGKSAGTAAAVRAVGEVLSLPLSDWTPPVLPEPRQSVCFAPECEGRNWQDILSQAILHSYDVREDSLKLKKSPELFEKLRGDYPVRREAPAFRLILPADADPAAVRSLSALGFRLDRS